MATYELRVYQAVSGRMNDLLARFRDHTLALFEDHGIENVGYWIDNDDADRLIYLLKHSDIESSWSGFREDPRWLSAKEKSEAQGPLTTSIASTRLSPTEFSALT
ncbi:NIPSNAP family protein [Leucobacter sp. W1038]|uniref:NIPSNAP family protein n=1 Tax=Leucobacter sp. W1038 TaxID=3438281 RepID=UPI003D97CC4A